MRDTQKTTAIKRYSAALLAPLVVSALMQLVWPFFEQSPVSPFLLAITFCAWYGGLGPGLLSVLISFLLADYFFIEPYHAFWPPRKADLVYLVTLTAVGTLISVLSEFLHRARRRAEINRDYIKQSENMYRALLNATSQVVWTTDIEGRILSGVPAWTAITGQSAEEMNGAGWMDALHVDDRRGLQDTWVAALHGTNSYETQARIRQSDGSYPFYLIRGVAVRGENGSVSGWIKSASDITPGKLAEERFRLVVEASPNAVVMANEQGNITLVNKRTEELFGYARAEMLGQPLEILIPERYHSVHPGHRAGFFENPSSRAMGAGRDLFGRRRDGSEVPLEIGLNPIRTDQGAFVLASIIDITERKRGEETLRRSQEQLAGVISSAMDAIISVDEDQRIVLFNTAAERMFFFPSEDAIGERLDRFIPERFRAAHKGHIQDFGTTHVTRRSMGTLGAIYGLRADGEEFPIEASISQIESEGKKIFTVILRDITERKRSEEALKEQGRILDLAPVLIRDLSGRIIFWNSGSERMYGWTREEALESTSQLLLKTEFPRPVEEIKARLFARGHWEGELVHTRRDGERIVVASHWVLHKNELDEPKAILEVNNDITERKEAEREIRRLNEELEQRVADRTAQLQAANKELEAFSYSVSHDLRAPLRHINGFSQALLEDYSDRLDDEGKKYLQEVRNASQEMAQLIDDVLQLARVTRSEMRREQVNLTAVARSVIADLQKTDLCRSVNVTIQDELTAQGDKRLLRIVLTNLLGNAWKFTSKQDQSDITFGTQQQNGEAFYFVRDNGAGFDMAYVNKLFGAFQRLHGSGQFEGTGIGLATVQRIITRHGGRVWAEGALNKGATFSFTLLNSKERGNEQESDSTS